MSVCHCNHQALKLPPEKRLLREVTVRLIQPDEKARHDQLLEQEHYLGNAKAVGQVLRYIAEYQGQWVAVLTFCSSALHLKPRDQLLGWTAREVRERRHLIAQNSRFLILPSTGSWPNLASTVLKAVCQRLPEDWERHFGHPVLLAETFVDPQRFRGTCYQSAGWRALGQTQGFQRRGQDFYEDLKHPKELWVRPLGSKALKQLQAEQLPASLQAKAPRVAPPPPIATDQMDSLWEFIRGRLPDPRQAKGIRHPLASILCIGALAMASGCQGPHAIAEFAQSLNHGQRRRLRCRPRRGAPRQFEVPCERTFKRLFAAVDPEELSQLFCQWMAQLDPQPAELLHLDGKVLKNTHPAPAKLQEDPQLNQVAANLDTAPQEQKPKAEKALTLVNVQTSQQRLVEQIAVPSDTNEEAAVAAHLPKMDLSGRLLIADAAHTIKANCRQITQVQGGDYLFFLKGNQPAAFAKARQLLPGDFPPSSPNDPQGTRSPG